MIAFHRTAATTSGTGSIGISAMGVATRVAMNAAPKFAPDDVTR